MDPLDPELRRIISDGMQAAAPGPGVEARGLARLLAALPTAGGPGGGSDPGGAAPIAGKPALATGLKALLVIVGVSVAAISGALQPAISVSTKTSRCSSASSSSRRSRVRRARRWASWASGSGGPGGSVRAAVRSARRRSASRWRRATCAAMPCSQVRTEDSPRNSARRRWRIRNTSWVASSTPADGTPRRPTSACTKPKC